MDFIEEKKQILLELMKDKHYVPMKFKELAVILNVKKEDRGLLNKVLTALVEEGKVMLSKRGKYSIPKEQYIQGRFIGHERGFGFVEVEGEEQDYFIPESATGDAFHHDMVLIAVEPIQTGKRKEGRVMKVLSHEIREVVGLFEKSKSFGYVLPDNPKIANDIYVAGKDTMGAVDGHKVVVTITDYGTNGRKPEGVITEILGHKNDPGVDIMSIVKDYDIPTEFPEAVMAQVEHVPDTVPEDVWKVPDTVPENVGKMLEQGAEDDRRILTQSGADDRDISHKATDTIAAGNLYPRKDIRAWQTVTIDGEDAKDLDDAITLTKDGGIYTLGVHIADVSHYVRENTPLDKEARERGTSVYLVDRVIPMLPHKLSNGICSLNQGVDRLALSCIMKINGKGEIIDHEITESVIRVDARMTYTAVNEIITDHNPETMQRYEKLVPMFEQMAELSSLLRKRRYNRGAVDFDFPECKIKLNEKGRPISIEPYERNAATKLIEDFMLAANETVAETFYWQQTPFVYRNHEKPDGEKMAQLTTFLTNFGYSIKVSQGEIHPKELQKLLEHIEGKPEEALLSRVTLRSMQRASYTPECIGHFGLAAKYYCHFTSPIRRYPDLQIHRIIKECLHGEMTDRHVVHFKSILPEVTKHCSMTERRADDAERDTEKLKKAEYMRGLIGEEFDGVISGVTGFGIYVELENTVEGLVHVSNMLDDHYIYDEHTYSMTGERTGKTYKLGQTVRIRVEAADKIARTIDFSMVE